MRSKLHIAILMVILSLATLSCKKDPAVNIESFEITKENMTIGAKTVNIMGVYSYSGTIDGITACVSENEYNFNVEEFPAELSGKNFRVDITGLTPGTIYYYYYMVDYGASKPYRTETNTFTTSDFTMPTVITATVSYVGHDNAICGGEVTDDGGSEVTARGLCWSQQHNPTLNDNHSVDSCGMGVFTTHISGLSLNTTYYARAYATNEKGTAYGSEMEFTTSAQTPTVTTLEVTEVDTTSARVKCEVVSDGGSTVTERGVCWSRQHEPTLDDDHLSNGSGLGIYACRLTGLDSNTKYYVRAYAMNASGTAFGEALTFTTGTVICLPSVTTVEVSEVTATTAVCLGNVSSDGGAEVTERGACWSTNQNPTISSSHANSGTGTGEFTVQMTGLTANKTYYVRAYAKNSKGVAYGEQKTFATAEGLPVVSTGSVTDITATSAKCSGNVSDQGASAVTERGICWGTSHNPTISGSHANNGTGTGLFVCNMTGLTPNTTYYVRAYAKNTQGTSYGSEVSFMALEGLPSVTTGSVTDITATTAKCSGNVTDQGASTVTERGICWATTHNPTISNSHANSGTGAGTYTCAMTGLTNGTTYYVRAYAKNTQGTTYGEEREFSTLANLPTVTTAEVTNITQTSATGGGNVTADGGATVTERGICWSTSQNPTVNGNHASNGSGTGTFSVNMTSLAPGTTYYVRAYATNSAGTAYGSQKSFTTTASMPTVTTGQVTNITQTTALGSGNVTSSGGATVTARGVCWSTSHNPTVSGSHASGGTGTGSFTANMTGLTANTTYYVRAYATNSQGTSYGSEVSFTTAQNVSAPTVTTSQVTNIQQTTAVGGGNVTSDGGASVTERGICWSTSHNPTTSGSHANNGMGTGTYTVQMSGLTANTTYYVRAYAINSAGTSYGSEVSFTTQQIPSYTISVSANPTNGGTVSGGGIYQQGQSCTVTATAATGYTFLRWTENGTQVSTNANYTFTVSGNRTLVAQFQAQSFTISVSANPSSGGSVSGGGTYTYGQSCTVTATANTSYAFTNWTEGGSQVSTNANYTFTVTGNRTLVANFTLQAGMPTVTTTQVTNITQTTATGGGNVTSDGGASVTTRGVCWSTSHNPTVSGSHTTNGTGTGSFTSSITGLTANTTYYVRAYATNSVGTAYGSEVSFTTQPSYPVGAINGLFTINSNGDQVYFSQGNLQYIGSASTPYYRFSDNQYDMLGAANQSSLDIDLLSTRFQYDWSDIVIENGGNESGIWHVLGMGEWIYLTMQRATSSGIPSTLAKVNNVDGLLVPPDDWDADLYPLSVNLSSSESNVISLDDWNTILEPSGVLFLPCAGGIRDFSGNWGYWDGPGNYWASDGYYPDPPIQDCILFRDGVNSSVHTNNAHVYCRLSVRLVKNYNP